MISWTPCTRVPALGLHFPKIRSTTRLGSTLLWKGLGQELLSPLKPPRNSKKAALKNHHRKSSHGQEKKGKPSPNSSRAPNRSKTSLAHRLVGSSAHRGLRNVDAARVQLAVEVGVPKPGPGHSFVLFHSNNERKPGPVKSIPSNTKRDTPCCFSWAITSANGSNKQRVKVDGTLPKCGQSQGMKPRAGMVPTFSQLQANDSRVLCMVIKTTPTGGRKLICIHSNRCSHRCLVRPHGFPKPQILLRTLGTPWQLANSRCNRQTRSV